MGKEQQEQRTSKLFLREETLREVKEREVKKEEIGSYFLETDLSFLERTVQ